MMASTPRLLVWFFAAATALGLAASQHRAEAGSFVLQGNELKLPGAVQFDTGSDKLRSESDAVLEYVASYLKEKTYVSLLRIEGHSDNQGNAAQAQTLTEKRALSVGRWLVAHGVECKRLLAVGFGASKPVADNATPEGRAQNRRISFINAALRGHAIGGMPADGGGRVAGELCP